MHVRFRFFFGAVYQTLTRAPVNARRLVLLAPFTMGFLPFELYTWLCMRADDVFYRQYRRIKPKAPVFIIGNPRSGTTHLHRLMAMDDDQFVGFNLQEILFPAVLQQRAFGQFARLDRAIGAPFSKLLKWVESRTLGRVDHIHRTRLNAPEEDEILLVHKFATPILFMLFPGARVLGDLWKYDALPDNIRRDLNTFYRECVKRLLYNRGQHRRFLSKNTAFGVKIKSLAEVFPDALFVYIIRNPSISIASTENMFHTAWNVQLDHSQLEEQRRRLVEKACLLYRHALRDLDRLSSTSWHIVHYEDLVADPERTIRQTYEALNLPLSPTYEEKLKKAAARARQYKSKHRYSMEQFGLSEEEIRAALPEVYNRFTFKEGLEAGQGESSKE